MIFLYLIPVNRNFIITQYSIFSLSRRLSEPEAQNPIFQCSNIPTFPPGRRPYGPEANCDLPARALQWQAGRSELI